MIGMIGSAQFVGWMAASMFLPRIGDLYGRKKPFIMSVLIAAVLYWAIIFTTDLHHMIGLFFLTGLTQAGKFSMAHVYIQELMPVRQRTSAGTIIQFFDASSLILIALYNRYVSNEWLPFQALGAMITTICFFALVIVPESPKWLYSKGRYNEARKALGFVLRFNNCLRSTKEGCIS